MSRRFFSFLPQHARLGQRLRTGLLAAGVALSGLAASAQTLRVAVHDSFSLPKPLVEQFERENGVKLSLIKSGDAGEMLNKLILTKARPIADVVYGLDNSLVVRAVREGVIEPLDDALARRPSAAPLDGSAASVMLPVDHGHIMLNYDRGWFERQKLALPRSLDDLTLPAYRNLVVVSNPATSSPGLGFLLATIAGMGEEKAFAWWSKMKANGIKVVKGWSDGYYTEFSRNGGTRPITLSYGTSPAAEVFYSKEKISEPPTGTLPLAGGVFQQIEGVALVTGGGERRAAVAFLQFLRSPGVQQALQTSLWMLPAEPGVALVDVMKHATVPVRADNPSPEQIALKQSEWVSRWTRTVLR